VIKKQIKRGKPGKNTTYQQKTQTISRLEYQLNQDALNQASLLDGIFPLVHNVINLTDKEILETYKKQPYLEKRHSTFKSVNQVAPVYLKKKTRIEAMLFLHFVALMVLSLMERNIRLSMIEQNIEQLPILPQGMNTKTPTWSNLFEVLVFLQKTKTSKRFFSSSICSDYYRGSIHFKSDSQRVK